jgi:hypothetical protein
MSDEWSKDEIKRLVRESGRPLEFRIAQAFIENNWSVSHGSYFTDVTSGSVREIDLIASRMDEVGTIEPYVEGESEDEPGSPEQHCGMGIFVSCKGFREDQIPLMYSLGKPFPESTLPGLMAQIRKTFPVKPYIRLHGLRHLFNNLGLDSSRRIAVLELAQRKLINSPRKYDYSRLPDKDLFEGLDSAFKAAIYWQGISHYCDVYLRVPILVTSVPWLDIPLDKGAIGEPTLATIGYKTVLYPFKGAKEGPELITSLICTESELPRVIGALNKVYDWFKDEVNAQLENDRSGP